MKQFCLFQTKRKNRDVRKKGDPHREQEKGKKSRKKVKRKQISLVKLIKLS